MRSKIFVDLFVLPALLRLFQDLSALRSEMYEDGIDYEFQIVEMQHDIKKLIKVLEDEDENN